MRSITFTIPGQPKGKQRPKVTMQGNYAHAYTPRETASYENYVKVMYQINNGGLFLEGAIKADITAYFPIPKSISKKNRELMLSGIVKYTKKVDCDNLAKIILDSLNGIAYKDDAQIYELSVTKLYDDKPRVVVTLTETDVKGG